VSLYFLQSRIATCQRELERHRDKQAAEEARAARLEGEAGRYDQQAARSSASSSARSHTQSAQRKRDEARRTRESAAKASKAVSEAQKKLHRAQTALAREVAQDQKRAEQRAARERAQAERVRRDEERRRQARDRDRDRELASLRSRAMEFEARLSSSPWASSPETIDVLFVAASPEDEVPLRLDHEVREIQDRIRMSEYRDAVRLHWRPAARVSHLFQFLNEVRPHIVHFSGHGDQDSLVFEDMDGCSKPLSTSDLGRLLHISSDRIRLAVFNSCESASQAEHACEHIDAAIGMDRPVEDDAAKIFAGQFYNAIGFGRSLLEAFEQARHQVKLVTGRTSGEPLLFTAAGVNAGDLYLVKPLATGENAA
jgi:CHAT domain